MSRTRTGFDAPRLRAAATRRARMHRLSELQGDNPMVLMLGRGEHCPRERQHQRRCSSSTSGARWRSPSSSPSLPNDLHDVFKLKIATGAYWTFLADEDLEVRDALDIDEYTDDHHDYAVVPHTRRARARACDRQGLRRLLVLGPALGPSALGRPPGALAADQGGLRPDAPGGASERGRRRRQVTAAA